MTILIIIKIKKIKIKMSGIIVVIYMTMIMRNILIQKSKNDDINDDKNSNQSRKIEKCKRQ